MDMQDPNERHGQEDILEVTGVVYYPLRCPHCGSEDHRVYRTKGGIPRERYHRCRGCGERFKSYQGRQKHE